MVYDELDATAMAALVQRGDVHARELVDAAIARAEAIDPALNAIIHRQFERARGDAEGVDLGAPFAGVPFLLKDYLGWEAGEPYHMGVATLKELDYRPSSDSRYARRVRHRGLIPIGRTNTPQMAAMGTTEPELYGPTHNPWRRGHSAGGSSGGAAAAVAAGIVPVAHANDISGSIRIPAAMCGVVGLKPTRGRVVASAADAPIGMLTEGVITRTVRDTAGLVDALTHRSPWWPAPGTDWPLVRELGAATPPLRVGVWTQAFNGAAVDADSAAAADAAASLLESMGHHVDVGAPDVFSSEQLWQVAKVAIGVAVAAEARAWTERIGHALGEDDLEPRTWAMVQSGLAVTGAELFEVITTLQELARNAFEWWERFDLLVTPTVPAPASPHGDYLKNYVSGLGSAFTRPINVTGQPAVSLPLGWPSDGLPRGVQLVAAYGRDDLLVSVAGALEAAAPWSQRRPPLD